MYIPSEKRTKDETESITHIILAVESANALWKLNLMEYFLISMKFDESLNIDMKEKIGIALRTRKNL